MTRTFRTVELSDPRFERDYLRFITVKSAHLKGRGDICVFLPPGIDARKSYPAVILLHGVYGSAWALPFKAGIHLQALKLMQADVLPPMVIAMPSDGLWGDGSGYLPHKNKDFEGWIAKDVPGLLQQYIDGITAESPLFISGLSMGGWGALHIGVKYANRFRAAAGHSSITNIHQMELFVEEDLSNYKQTISKEEEDLFEVITHHQDNLPPLYFDCGKSDLLIDYNRNLHAKLEQANIKHQYNEYLGGHSWSYWQKHLKKSLLFFCEAVKEKGI
jgi:enterochelin esterase-like enzyme